MKEVTFIRTMEITDVVSFTDEEFETIFGDIEARKRHIEHNMRRAYKFSDDVHAKVQFFVRDVND